MRLFTTKAAILVVAALYAFALLATFGPQAAQAVVSSVIFGF